MQKMTTRAVHCFPLKRQVNRRARVRRRKRRKKKRNDDECRSSSSSLGKKFKCISSQEAAQIINYSDELPRYSFIMQMANKETSPRLASKRASCLMFAMCLLLSGGSLLPVPANFVGASSLADFDGATFYKAPVGSRIRIACNASHWSDDSISLILWFKGNPSQSANSQPIYTIDARQKPLSSGAARHLVSDSLKGRAKFVIPSQPARNSSAAAAAAAAAAGNQLDSSASLVPYLDLFPLEPNDQAEYRCRVDYRSRPRENFLMILFVLVPPSSVEVMDSKGRSLEQIYGPLNEGSDLTLLCLARGGRPAPAITWKQNGRVIDETYLTLNDFFALKLTGQMLTAAAATSSSSSAPLKQSELEMKNSNWEQLKSLDNFFSGSDSDSPPPTAQTSRDNNLTTTRSLLDSINELRQSKKSDSSNGQHQRTLPGLPLIDSLWRDWSGWPEFEHFDSVHHRQQPPPPLADDDQLAADKSESPFAGFFALAGNETNNASQRQQQQHLHHRRPAHSGGKRQKPSDAGEQAESHAAASLLELPVDETTVTSINYLRLLKLGRATLFSSPDDFQAAAKRPPNSSQLKNNLLAAKIECEASNLHYDLRSLIRIFAPPTLVANQDEQQPTKSTDAKRAPSEPATTGRQQTDSQLAEAIERALRANLRQPQQQLDPPAKPADQRQQQQSISAPLSFQSAPTDQRQQQQQQTTLAGEQDNNSSPQAPQHNWPAVIYQQLVRPHQLSSSSMVATAVSRGSQETNREFVQSRLIALEARLRPLDVHLAGPQRALAANQLAEFTCTSTGSLPAAKLIWLKDGQPLAARTNSTDGNERPLASAAATTGQTQPASLTNSSASLVSTSRLTLKLERTDHNRRLSCRAENEFLKDEHPEWTIEDSILLNVQYQPKLKLELGNEMLSESTREGNDIYFVCHVDAQPAVGEITWLHNDKPINESSLINGAERSAAGQLIISNNSLVLQRVQMEQRGQYACLASNSEGLAASNRIELRVMHAPTCVGPMQRQPEEGGGGGGGQLVDSLWSPPATSALLLGTRFLPLKSNSSFRCRMLAEPADGGDDQLEFTWYLNNTLNERRVLWTTTTTTNDQRRAGNAGRQSTSEDLHKDANGGNSIVESQLELKFDSTKDFGQLYCLARNSIGEQKRACVYSIEQLDETEALACLPVNVTDNSVWIGCEHPQTSDSNAVRRQLFKFRVVVATQANSNWNFQQLEPEEQQHHQSGSHVVSLVSDTLDEPLFEIVNLLPDTGYQVQIGALNSFNGLRLNGIGQSRVRFRTAAASQVNRVGQFGEDGTATQNSNNKHRPIIRRVTEPHNNSDLISAALISARPTTNLNQRANKLLLTQQAAKTNNATIWSTIWSQIFKSGQSTATSDSNNKQRYLATLVGQSRASQSQTNKSQVLDLAADSGLLAACLCVILLVTLVGLLLINRLAGGCFSSAKTKQQQQQQQVDTTRSSDGSKLDESDNELDVSSMGSGGGARAGQVGQAAKVSPPSCSTTATQSDSTTPTVGNNSSTKQMSKNNNDNFLQSANCASSSYSSTCSPPVSSEQHTHLGFQSMLAPPMSSKSMQPKSNRSEQMQLMLRSSPNEQLIDSARLLPFENYELNSLDSRRLSAANSPRLDCVTNLNVATARPRSHFDSLPSRRSGQQQRLNCLDLTTARQITLASNNSGGGPTQLGNNNNIFGHDRRPDRQSSGASEGPVASDFLYANQMQMNAGNRGRPQRSPNLNPQQSANVSRSRSSVCFDSLLASSELSQNQKQQAPRLIHSSGPAATVPGEPMGGKEQPQRGSCLISDANSLVLATSSENDHLRRKAATKLVNGQQQQQPTLGPGSSTCNGTVCSAETDTFSWPYNMQVVFGDKQHQQAVSGSEEGDDLINNNQEKFLAGLLGFGGGDEIDLNQAASLLAFSSHHLDDNNGLEGENNDILLTCNCNETIEGRQLNGTNNNNNYLFAQLTANGTTTVYHDHHHHHHHQAAPSKCSSSLLTTSDTDSSDPTTASNNNNNNANDNSAPLAGPFQRRNNGSRRCTTMATLSDNNKNNQDFTSGGGGLEVSNGSGEHNQTDCFDINSFNVSGNPIQMLNGFGEHTSHGLVYSSCSTTNNIQPPSQFNGGESNKPTRKKNTNSSSDELAHRHFNNPLAIANHLQSLATTASSSLGSSSIKDQIGLSPLSNSNTNTTLSQTDSTLELVNIPEQSNGTGNAVEFVADQSNHLTNYSTNDNQSNSSKSRNGKLTSILKKNSARSSPAIQGDAKGQCDQHNLCQCNNNNQPSTNL